MLKYSILLEVKEVTAWSGGLSRDCQDVPRSRDDLHLAGPGRGCYPACLTVVLTLLVLPTMLHNRNFLSAIVVIRP